MILKNMSAFATYFALFIAGKILNILIPRFLIHNNFTLEQVATFDRSIEQKSEARHCLPISNLKFLLKDGKE